MVEKSASPIPKTPEVQKSDTKQEIIDETDDEEDIPLKKIVKSKKAQSLKKTPSNANTANSASRPKRSRKVPKKLQDNSDENEDAFPEYDVLDFEDSPDEYVPKKTSRRSRDKSKKVQADSDDSDEWKPGVEDEVEEPFERGNNYTVWKFQEFSVIQILREINFWRI